MPRQEIVIKCYKGNELSFEFNNPIMEIPTPILDIRPHPNSMCGRDECRGCDSLLCSFKEDFV